jgi:hypothetical protein
MNAKVETAKAPETKTTVQAKDVAKEPAPAKAPMVSLKAICAEMKLDLRLAREKLRIAAREAKKYPELAKAHKPRSAWEWAKGSQAEKEARTALAS